MITEVERMTRLSFAGNKKGAALIYAIMVLLFLSTMLIAVLALSSASYSDAVLAASDDQSYYYAKSIGIAMKEQFKDGYNINKIITALDAAEAERDNALSANPNQTIPVPTVTGEYTMQSDDGEYVTGTIVVSYARKDDGSYDEHTIEVRTSCIVNNSMSIVTSIFSSLSDSEEKSEQLSTTLTDYDVILTDPSDLDFDFAQADEGTSGTSNLSVFVYAGEDDGVTNTFKLRYNMAGMLTTTGNTTIKGVKLGDDDKSDNHKITGSLTSYGTLTLSYVEVEGKTKSSKEEDWGVYADGDLKVGGKSFVKYNIYARGNVSISDPGYDLHYKYVASTANGKAVLKKDQDANVLGDNQEHYSAKNIYAQGKVSLAKRSWVKGSIYSHDSVTVTGKGARPDLDNEAGGFADHFGNTLVEGSIYADGDVTISEGAIVAGSIYAGGKVTVKRGAIVMGNVQSVSSGIDVKGGVIGGQVNCPQGTLLLTNAGYESYSRYFTSFDFGFDTMLYGGIGVFYVNNGLFDASGNTKKPHTCNALDTGDSEYMVRVRADLYVTTGTKNNNKKTDFTPFLSIWCHNRVVLCGSSALFRKDQDKANYGGSARTCVGMNPAGNPYTFIQELSQKADLAVGSNSTAESDRYIDMCGAHINTLNVGEKKSELYDAYIKKGWVGYMNARCILMQDMEIGERTDFSVNEGALDGRVGYIYASRYMEVAGTGSSYSGTYKRSDSPTGCKKKYDFGSGWSFFRVGPTIEIGCVDDSYSGKFTKEERYGFMLGVYTEIYCLVSVGAASGETASSYVVLGDESKSGATKFYGGLNAYVGNFQITESTRLATWNGYNGDNGTAVPLYASTILAEVIGGTNPKYSCPTEAKDTFYVEELKKTNSAGNYRYGSRIQVKGAAYIAGLVYDFEHFPTDDGKDSPLTNTASARFKGTFISASKELNIKGTDCFNVVKATNAEGITTLTGALTVNGLHLYGKLNVNSQTLIVHGDMYVETLTNPSLYKTTVDGNLTIGSINGSSSNTLTATTLTVKGSLYLRSGNIGLTSSAHAVTGTVETGNGGVTVKGGAKVNKAYVIGVLKVESGGVVQGDFYATRLNLCGGTVSHATKRIYSRVQYYQHSSGNIEKVDIYVTNSGPTSVEITGGTGYSVFITTNGGAQISGGSSLNYYQGGLYAEKATTIKGTFKCGVTCKAALTIGDDSDTTEYSVGYANSSTDPESSGYSAIYSAKTIVWKGGAIGSWYDGLPSRAACTIVSAKESVKMGTASRPVKGAFSEISSETSSVEAYVSSVISVKAETGAMVGISGFPNLQKAGSIGLYYGGESSYGSYFGDLEEESGIRTNTGDAHVKWIKVSGLTADQYRPLLYGHFQIAGNLYIENEVDAIARISAKDIYDSGTGDGLKNVKMHDGGLWLSIDLKKSYTGFYKLKYSLQVHGTHQGYKNLGTEQNPVPVSYTFNDTGDFSVNGALEFDSSVSVWGKLHVNGIFKYNGSETDLICRGGLYCLNGTVNLLPGAEGDVELPNVTSITLNGRVGLNAPKVTSISLDNVQLDRSLSLKGCTSVTLSSTTSIAGSLEIADNGKVVNNGSVGESIKCGYYEGSGSVGKDLVLLKSDKTSKITGAGSVKGNIWSKGSLDIKTSREAAFGGFQKNNYIYAAKDITIESTNTSKSIFESRMDYILSTGGNIYLKNCKGFVPKVWNMSGSITISNGGYTGNNSTDRKKNENLRAEITSILSYGTYIWIGESRFTNYQTIKGNIEWYGSYTPTPGVHESVDFWSNNGDGTQHTIVNGNIYLKGTGSAHLSSIQIDGNVIARQSGPLYSNADGVIKGDLTVNTSSSKTVNTVESVNTVKGNVVLFGNSSSNFKIGAVGSGATNYLHVRDAKTTTVTGKVNGDVWAQPTSDGTLTLEKGSSFSVEIWGGTLVTGGSGISAADATVAGNVVAHNANLQLLGNVGAGVLHSAANVSDWKKFKLVELGARDKQITVGGGIVAHGRVVDNSKQTTVDSYMWIKGAYYVDFKKSFANCIGFFFTTEAGGNCTIIGDPWSDWTIDTPFDIQGRLVILTFYEAAKDTYWKLTFNKQIKANALVVDSEMDGTGNIDYVCASNILLTGDQLEDFRTCDVSYNIWWSGRQYNQCTSKDRVQFLKPVFLFKGNGYNGTCHASNAAFKNPSPGGVYTGSSLYTEGQVSLNYCYFESRSYKNPTNHCFSHDVGAGAGWYSFIWDYTIGNTYYSNGPENWTMDGSMFVHSNSSTGGNNYFKNVQTKSNVSSYYGVNYMLDTELEGCVVDTSSGHIGHPSTKLYYFGDSVYMKSSHVKTSMNKDTDIPAGRTIIWVAKGALVLDNKSWIGDQFYDSRPGKGSLNTNKQSCHPGVFVSDTSSGDLTFSFKKRIGTSNSSAKKFEEYNDSTTYKKGRCEVKGSITLDIVAYRGIKIHSEGVVSEKGNNDSSSKAYKAGFYVSYGEISNSGFFGLFSAESGSRHYYHNGSDKVANEGKIFKPYTTYYAEYMQKCFSPSDKNTMSIWYTWSYTPLETKPRWADANNISLETAAPVGINVNPVFPSWMSQSSKPTNGDTYFRADFSDTDPSFTETGKKSAPSQPSLSAEGTIFGDATVSTVTVNNPTEAESALPKTTVATPSRADKVEKTDADLAFAGWKANATSPIWSAPSFTPTGVSITNPASKWTSKIKEHLDKTMSQYWNPRFVPYIWQLPYEGKAEGETKVNNTPARRVLSGTHAASDDNKNGEAALTEPGKTESYYVNSKHYDGSSLKSQSSRILGDRNKTDGTKWDYVVWNSQYDSDQHDLDTRIYLATRNPRTRQSKIFVFESGELPYSAFYKDTDTAKTSWGSGSGGNISLLSKKSGGNFIESIGRWLTSSNEDWRLNMSLRGNDDQQPNGKRVSDNYQYAWSWGGPADGAGGFTPAYYDISMVFYTCADPSKPFTSAAKDLHVVLPQGIGLEFYNRDDLDNTVTVVGNGRLFLYLTSGDTVYFGGHTNNSHGSTIYYRPIGGLKQVGDHYEPLMYIIGAGTNIDLIVREMPLAAMVYMPFGTETSVYGSSGSLKDYNKFTSLANNSKFSSLYGYTQDKSTTDVHSNRLILAWNDSTSGTGNPRTQQGTILADQFLYFSATGTNNLNFANSEIRTDLSSTTIYKTGTSGGKTYDLGNFLKNAPSFSTKLLNWEYEGIEVNR